MTDTTLKPCPFDGGEGVLDNRPHGDHSTAYFIRCRSCACEGPWARTEKGATVWWNMRQPEVAT